MKHHLGDGHAVHGGLNLGQPIEHPQRSCFDIAEQRCPQEQATNLGVVSMWVLVSIFVMVVFVVTVTIFVMVRLVVRPVVTIAVLVVMRDVAVVVMSVRVQRLPKIDDIHLFADQSALGDGADPQFPV